MPWKVRGHGMPGKPLCSDPVIRIADRTWLLDLTYLGRPGHIATAVLETDAGLALVDPGPATTVDRLRSALVDWGATIGDVRFLLITHIHLDHSGGAGTLAAELPQVRILVHERGAPHLADPARLLRSATMIYGDRMQELWGDVVPVPGALLQPLAGGETVRLGNRQVETCYTPGHASHHLAWFDRATGVAFTGDVLGEHLPDTDVPIPVTPPPDIDVEEMLASGERILGWHPERLFLTHFGPVGRPPEFVADHARRLVTWSERVRRQLETGGDDEELAVAFRDQCRDDLEAALPANRHPEIPADELHGNWFGLARYWRGKA